MKAFTADHASRYSRINRAWLDQLVWADLLDTDRNAHQYWSDDIPLKSSGILLPCNIESCRSRFRVHSFLSALRQRLCSIDKISSIFFFFFSVEGKRRNDLYLNRDRNVFLDGDSDRMWYRDWHFLGYDRDSLADRCRVTRVSISSVSVSTVDSTFVLLRFNGLLFGQGCRHEGEHDEKLQQRSNSNYTDIELERLVSDPRPTSTILRNNFRFDEV